MTLEAARALLPPKRKVATFLPLNTYDTRVKRYLQSIPYYGSSEDSSCSDSDSEDSGY